MRTNLEAPIFIVGGFGETLSFMSKSKLLGTVAADTDWPTIQNLERNSVITKHISPSKWAMMPLDESLKLSSLFVTADPEKECFSIHKTQYLPKSILCLYQPTVDIF